MNNKILLFLITIVIGQCFKAQAEIGCMDKSNHLQKKFDYKAYHYVQCNCPCKKHTLSSERGICIKCRHYHDPREFEILHFEEDRQALP